MNKKPVTLTGIPWSLSSIWNERLDAQPERPLMPRNYLYASELGGAFCDRYLKMYAVPYSNPPNLRSKRKFTAGDAWEWLAAMVISSCGILQKKQIKVDTQMKNCLSVHGRLDFVAGGQFNHDEVKKQIQRMKDVLCMVNLETPPFFYDAAEKFADKYKDKFLEMVIFEFKSVSSFMMEKVKRINDAMDHHKLQDFHYVAGNEEKIQRGKISYTCKDDCIQEEFYVENSKEIRKVYVDDVRQMTEYYNAGFNKKNPLKLMPPKEPEVIFDDALFKFSKNWKVEYSPYLTLLYGYETPKHYGQWKWQAKAAAWSNAFKKFVQAGQEIEYTNSKGEKATKVGTITDNNREKRDEAIEHGFPWDKLVAKAKAAGAFRNTEEEEEE